MYGEWYGVCDFVVLSGVEVCVDYGGMNVFHVCWCFCQCLSCSLCCLFQYLCVIYHHFLNSEFELRYLHQRSCIDD